MIFPHFKCLTAFPGSNCTSRAYHEMKLQNRSFLGFRDHIPIISLTDQLLASQFHCEVREYKEAPTPLLIKHFDRQWSWLFHEGDSHLIRINQGLYESALHKYDVGFNAISHAHKNHHISVSIALINNSIFLPTSIPNIGPGCWGESGCSLHFAFDSSQCIWTRGKWNIILSPVGNYTYLLGGL